MELNPDEARLLATALLSDDEVIGPHSGATALGDRSAQLAAGTFGRYRLVRLVASGGMGEVYEAQQEHPQRKVALKVIRADVLSPEAAARFEHEARILGRLQHPGIARIYEAGRNTAQGVSMPYFAMEFVDGRPLLDYVQQNRLSLPARLDLFVCICEAVEHAHRMGVIHRDLKPGNILVDATGQPRVLDFGVARATDSDVQATTVQTDVGRLVGTLAYMSPEQVSADSANLDTRSDVYALGVLLYELLSGRPPYRIDAGRVHEAARVIIETEPAPLGTTDRALRGDVQTIVSKALAKERDRRYQSVGDLAADIRRYLHNEPIEARPASAVYQLAKFSRRHRALVLAATIGFLSIAAAAVVSTIFAVGESAARKEAQARAKSLEEEEAVTEEISNFLQTTFVALAPKRLGRDAKVIDAVRQGVKELEQDRPSSPRVEAALRHAFGYALTQLGDANRAIDQLQVARELIIPISGLRSEDTVNISRDLAFALLDAGRPVEAETLLREIVDTRTQLLGPDDDLTLTSEDDLASCLMQQDRFAEARPILQSVLDRRRRAQGDNSPGVMSTMHNLAAAFSYTGELEEALRMAHTVMDYTAAIDQNSVDYLSDAEMVAGLERKSGHPAEAEALLRRVLNGKQKLFGDNHIEVLTTRGNIAAAILDQGRASDAEAEFRALLVDLQRLLAPSHPFRMSTTMMLAGALADQDKHAESLAAMDELLVSIRDASDVPPIVLGGYQLGRAGCLRSCGRWEEAAAQGVAAWITFKSAPGSADNRLVEAARLLVHIFDHLHQPDKAAEFRAFLAEKGAAMPDSSAGPDQDVQAPR